MATVAEKRSHADIIRDQMNHWESECESLPESVQAGVAHVCSSSLGWVMVTLSLDAFTELFKGQEVDRDGLHGLRMIRNDIDYRCWRGAVEPQPSKVQL